MSEQKHTPGPWSLQTVTTSVGICHKIGPFPWKTDKHNHACIYVDYGRNESELRANAHLIAAAPDLLEALKGVICMAEDLVEEYGGNADKDQNVLFARAAIAKAEGEQQ